MDAMNVLEFVAMIIVGFVFVTLVAMLLCMCVGFWAVVL